MYDKTEMRILEQIYIHPGIHKRELSKTLKLGMPSIDYGLKKIDKIISQKTSGNQIHYFLDYSKDMLSSALSAIEHSRFERLPAKVRLSVRDFLRELEVKPIIAIIFGSYASSTYTKNSDIDVLLVFQNFEDSKKIENTSKKISMKTNTQLHPVYLGYPEFKESFHNLTKEFFKKLKKDKIIVIGMEWWRQLIDEET
ncbi:MAG: nucleotidyltransferase domain-containing protein [Candidatus Woesearchaeota archaeon]|jgi:predicted nucleotidyltransferase|nr:nucleotidyltransferase domain-containing protein [Candidatus Woesearchaeota archaeon]MDP7324276.1 nucleotidyltransferase domain-containing protein [Candidatus Woesearchaeota archaeon]MDP7457219.1 nucleotidyltransferase domain-containing protein [Candidatus Woesearchaeota archaeon]